MAADGDAAAALSAMVAPYRGHTRVKRLLFVARRAGGPRAEAYRLALAELRAQGRNVELYEQTQASADEALGAGVVAEPGADAWKKAAHRAHAEAEAALGEEFQAALRSSVKPRIREAVRRHAEALALRGDWSAAMGKFLEMKDYAESEEDTLDAAMGAVKAAVNADAMGHVKNQANRALQLRGVFAEGRRPEARSHLLALQALYELGRHSFNEAAATLLRVDPRHLEAGRGFDDVLTREDAATFLVLCCLASFDRQALKLQLLDSEAFRRYTEGSPRLLALVESFHQCRFGDCFAELARMRGALQLDLYVGAYTPRLLALIRERALILYLRPFVSVRLSRMAEAFAVDVADLERELIALIGDKKVHARLDAAASVLHSKNADARQATFREAAAAGETYVRNARSALLRMSLVEQDIKVPGPKGGVDDDLLDDYAEFGGFGDYGGPGGMHGYDMDMAMSMSMGGGPGRRGGRRP